jgi:hypothetical protein
MTLISFVGQLIKFDFEHECFASDNNRQDITNLYSVVAIFLWVNILLSIQGRHMKYE